jgi:hypothetical protein
MAVFAWHVGRPALERRRTKRYWQQTIRNAAMQSPPARRYDPATSNIYSDARVLTPNRY